jgi:8-oxo-dGTP pyrophosphatase MutT (NUDIX family)
VDSLRDKAVSHVHEQWQDLTERFPRLALASAGRQRSVVAIVVVSAQSGSPYFLLTRRSATLRRHPGQYALPGGKLDPDESIVEGMRRELVEELGLDLQPSAVVGMLDDYATRSGFLITPVVVSAGEEAVQLRPDPAEVAHVHTIPIDELGVTPTMTTIPESTAPVIKLPLLGGFVHAPTGAILYQFGELAVHGRVTRVAHLEQPVFAWR